MSRVKRLLCMTMIVCIGLFAAGCGEKEEEKAAEPGESKQETVRVGSNLALGTATPFVIQEKGFAEDSDIKIEILEFSDGSALMEAFAAGELDIALVGVSPVATWLDKGVDMKVIAAANGGGHVLMTRKDVGIDSVEQLKGKFVAEPSIATVTDSLLRSKILKEAGLDPEEDLTLVPGMKPADMATVLMATREVDAMITWEPYASQAEDTYGEEIQVLYDSAEVIKEETKSESFYPVNVVAASQDFIDNHQDALQEFLKIYKQTVDFINEDPEANAVLAKVLELKEEVIESARKRIDYTYEVDQEATLETLQWAQELGYIKQVPDRADLFYEAK